MKQIILGTAGHIDHGKTSLVKAISGIDTDRAIELVHQIAPLESLDVCGLMTMPPFFNAPEKVRPYFRDLKDLQHKISSEAMSNVHMAELSMGMSGDFETAIAEGATLVRVGTAIFGERPKRE